MSALSPGLGSICRHSFPWMSQIKLPQWRENQRSHRPEALSEASVRTWLCRREWHLKSLSLRMGVNGRRGVHSVLIAKLLKTHCCLKATFVVFKTWGFNTCKCCLEDNCNIKRKKMSRGLWGRILVLRDHEKLSMYISVLGETPKTNTHTWAWVAYSYKHMNM